jgi:hypothetical protein
MIYAWVEADFAVCLANDRCSNAGIAAKRCKGGNLSYAERANQLDRNLKKPTFKLRDQAIAAQSREISRLQRVLSNAKPFAAVTNQPVH